MFVGHSGVSFTSRAVGKRVPLSVWFLAVQWMDIVWCILVLCGVEKLQIVPGFTQAKALDRCYMPLTHGLTGSIAFSLSLGGAAAAFIPGNRVMSMLLAATASFS